MSQEEVKAEGNEIKQETEVLTGPQELPVLPLRSLTFSRP